MIREFIAKQVLRLEPIREIIGRVAAQFTGLYNRFRLSIDRTLTDHEFWDRLRRGKAKGYELGGLFAQPIVEILASWVLGEGMGAKLVVPKEEAENERVLYTNDLLLRWLRSQMARITLLYEDHLALGDQYAVMNPDGTLAIPSPETVERIEDDFGTLIGYRITAKLEKVTIIDELRLDGRSIIIKRAGQSDEVQTYQNLIGRLPVIHFANDRGNNETYGRPIYERLLRLFRRYDDLLEKGLDGAELMGNPIPVFEGMKNIDETIDANKAADETYIDKEGNPQSRAVINFDLLAALFIGEGGHFQFASPSPGFTDDIRNILKLLFLLMLDSTRIPEFVWGGAVESSKASAETQLPPFVKFIMGRRARFEGRGADEELDQEASGGLLELIDVWLRTRQLTDPRILVGPVAIDWPELVEEDQAQQLARLSFAKQNNLITDETTLRELDLVDDPAKEVGQARDEAKQRQDEFNARLEQDAQDELTKMRADKSQPQLQRAGAAA